jgi:hypothetical protein
MDGQLTNRLLALGLKDEPSITRNIMNDCLFLCFVECCKNTDSKNRKFRVTNDGKYLAQFPTHLVRHPLQREEVDISTATGMRLLSADAATYMLSEQTPNAQAPLLKRHILHRFRSAHMRKVDSEALNGEQLPDSASDDEKVEYWKKLMRMNGAAYHACVYVIRRHCLHTGCIETLVSMIAAGWGDTATIMVLSEVLDVDVHLYMPPDVRLSSRNLPNKFRPLLFRRSTHTKPAVTKMVLRFHQCHFIYMARFKDKGVRRTGVFADHEHYPTGTHDVATGRCV